MTPAADVQLTTNCDCFRVSWQFCQDGRAVRWPCTRGPRWGEITLDPTSLSSPGREPLERHQYWTAFNAKTAFPGIEILDIEQSHLALKSDFGLQFFTCIVLIERPKKE